MFDYEISRMHDLKYEVSHLKLQLCNRDSEIAWLRDLIHELETEVKKLSYYYHKHIGVQNE